MEKTIHELLVEVQKELKAHKGQTNTFGKYNYRSCEDIIEAVKPLLHSRGLYLNITDFVQYFGDRYYVTANASVVNKEGLAVTSSASAREAEKQSGMAEAQITGSASSYARKYALNGLLAIDDTKDDDHNNKGLNTPPTTTVTPKPITPPSATMQPSTSFEDKATAERRAKASGFFDKLDTPKVLAVIIKSGHKYTDVKSFVKTEPIDVVLALYEKVKDFKK